MVHKRRPTGEISGKAITVASDTPEDVAIQQRSDLSALAEIALACHTQDTSELRHRLTGR